MKYIIVDLEATCWEERKGRTNETIEIGAVSVNEKQEIIDEFQKFVKPVVNPVLSDFCRDLTSISQADVDQADTFPIVIQQFLEWIGKDYLLCSWGHYDKVQFKNDCHVHQMDDEWTEKHISLKHQYRIITKSRRPLGMKRALKAEGIPLNGMHHRGIDDARNINKIFLKHFDAWEKK